MVLRMSACALAGLAMLAVPPSVNACPVGLGSSWLSFSGVATPTPPGTTWADAEGVHFGPTVVTEATGLYSGLSGRDAPHTSFSFAALESNPVSPLWVLGPYSFTLMSVTSQFRDPTGLLMSGWGYLAGPGIPAYRPRTHWEFFALYVDGRYSFMSTNSGFPEPATVALLGLGALGAARLTRRRRSSSTHAEAPQDRALPSSTPDAMNQRPLAPGRSVSVKLPTSGSGCRAKPPTI